jgi:CRISPR-associated protein Csm4
MQAVILKCKPGSRFHLGQAAMRQHETLSDTAEIIHSDVLFGAFINAVAQRLPDAMEIWKNHFETGEIRFSSAFYCLECNGNYVYLLPKPVSLNIYDLSQDKNLKNAHKKLKKVLYLSKGIWERQLLPNDWFSENGLCLQPEKRLIILKEELTDNNSRFKLSEKADTQKVKVRTDDPEGNLYTQTDLVIMGNDDVKVHWYFLVEMSALPEEEQRTAKSLIESMAGQGIGGERSTGCGQVEGVEYAEEFSLSAGNDSNQFMALSLIIPKVQERDSLLAYQIIQRGSMYYRNASQNCRIKMVDTLAEGSVLKGSIVGQIADLSEDYKKHWRGGTCLAIPLPKAYSLKLQA